MKKILCLSTGMSSGGAERQLSVLSVLLKEKGYDVEVAWYYDSDFYQPYLEKHQIKCKHLFADSYYGQLLKIYKEIRSYRPDVVISYMEGAALLSSLIKFLGGHFYLIASERNVTEQITFKRKIRFFLYRKADAIIPNSYTQAELLINKYPQLARKIRTITNFTDTKYFVPSPQINYNEYDNVPIRMLIVSRINEKKNTHRFIKALDLVINKHNLRDIVVDWYGNPHEGKFYEECTELIRNCDLDRFINLHSSTKNILKEYQKAQIFCLPSTSEGFPNALSEAMCCGLPVLAGAVCDNPKIVSDGENGYLFNPYSVEDMADKMALMLARNFNQLRQMGAKSRLIAERLFSKSKFVEQYIKLIEEV